MTVHFGIYHILGRMEALAGKMEARARRVEDEDLFRDAIRLRELIQEAEDSLQEERRLDLERDLKSSIDMLKARKDPGTQGGRENRRTAMEAIRGNNQNQGDT